MKRRPFAPAERELLALLSGALEPGERGRLEARLRVDPRLRATLEALRPPARPAAWSLPTWRPPVRLGAPILAATMGGGAEEGRRVQPGAELQISVAPVEEPEGWRIAHLEEVEGRWAVLHPTDRAAELPLSRFQPDATGARQILLLAPRRPGPYRWALLLLPPTLQVRWEEEDPWAEAREALLRGEAEVSVLDFEVV